MAGLVFGLILGLLAASAVAGAVGVWAYRKYVVLERRAVESDRLRREAQRLAELGTLTGGLAHEIKNPLSTVQLNLELIREDLDPNNPQTPRIHNRLTTVVRETARLREILDAFLRYAGRLELERRPVDVNEILEELCDFFAPQAQQSRVHIRLTKSPVPLVCEIDPRLIKQTLLNLMLNAVQAMTASRAGEASGQWGELILRARREERAVDPQGAMGVRPAAVIDVIDTGPGIPKDVRDKVFEAYYSSRRGGTGLGLAIARRIIREHGGAIGVDSEPGKGSDFWIQLPLVGG